MKFGKKWGNEVRVPIINSTYLLIYLFADIIGRIA